MNEEERTAPARPGDAFAQQDADGPSIVTDAPPAHGGLAHRAPNSPLDRLPIVAIGTSAGGLEAVSRLLDAISSAIAHSSGDDVFPDIAFLLVQHLDPTHHSLLAELLAKHTAMRVVEASDGVAIVAGHLYIIPPGRYLSVSGGTLHLSTPEAPHGARMPFDYLLKSLADGYAQATVGVVLSGTGLDGSLGLSALAEARGFVIAQDPGEAEYDGMPRNAIATGYVDRILRLAEMPAAFVDHARRVVRGDAAPDGDTSHPEESATEPLEVVEAVSLAAILSLLHQQTAQDFRQYKSGTIVRRIERRMGLLTIERNDLAGYLDLLRKRPAECDLLAKDLLIHVTGFFRDPKVFDTLEKTIIPNMIEACSPQQTLRIWVAGCSTGEEAYSIAMVCRDAIAAAKRGIKLQIFASDVDPDAVAVAREGLYPLDIVGTVPQGRLSRYFTKEDNGYLVEPGLRGDVVFTVQDLLTDPPFSRIDLVSCRNLLIYLNPEAQAKVIALFHFALREGGILMLGLSETVGSTPGRFEVVAKTERLYRHIGRNRPGDPGYAFNFGETMPRLATASRDPAHTRPGSLADICAKAVLAGHAPAAVLINRQRQVLYAMGPTSRYLQLASGYASHDLLAMAAPAVRRKLKLAIEQAEGGAATTTTGPASPPRHGGRTRLTIAGETIWFSISVERLAGENQDLLLVCFVEEPASDTALPASHGPVDTSRIAELERELDATRAELQASIQNEETSNQEQKAINEEALSVNEEFQSTNEELLTSKEELQSLNEELTALNSQLQETLDRQRLTSDDLQNVLYSTNVGTLFLDAELNIRFYTPAVSSLFHIIPGDIGRPLTDLRSLAADDTLLADAHKVIQGAASIEHEVAAPGGICFLRRIFPYLTHDGRIEGVVITFADITERNAIQHALEATKLEAERANVAKSRFLAAASHDLRQPLQSLTLLRELLVQSVEGEKPKKLLARFETTLQTISGMLNALLDINQIEAGVVKPKPVVFPLAALFERMRDEFSYVAQARQLSLRIMPTSALVESDPPLLEQIIRNLLGNAIKYTETGKILLGVRRCGRFLKIAVGDTGIGIAEDELQAIFEEFHQVGNEARERSRGLGLGLSIVQRLGRLLDHDITVQSVPGKGSLFTITVPVQKTVGEGSIVTPAEPALLPDAIIGQQHRCKIVVVDDDPDILELLQQLLKAEGYIVRVAANAAAALELVAGGAIHPEILLTDYNLPDGINGLELLAKLGTMLNHSVPGIILTGDIGSDTMARIARQDCIQLSKPVNPHELVQAIERLRRSEHPIASIGYGDPVQKLNATTYIVDDDPEIRATICEVLEGDGYTAQDFASSEDFLAGYRPGSEGCLLVDAHLPGMSGVGLLRALRARGDHLPVILITGDGDIGLAVEAMRAGACEFIEKPVSRADLLASIARAIAQSHDIRLVDAIHEGAAALVAELTDRQREIMNMVLAGHPSKNIAADLGISQRTVENHRAAVMERMGVKSLPELARIVVRAEASSAAVKPVAMHAAVPRKR
jgi:two-component system CheB/CheR fusion protein